MSELFFVLIFKRPFQRIVLDLVLYAVFKVQILFEIFRFLKGLRYVSELWFYPLLVFIS